MNQGGNIRPRLPRKLPAEQAPPQEAGADGGAHLRPDPRGQHGGGRGGGYEGKGHHHHHQGGRGYNPYHGGRGGYVHQGGRTWSTENGKTYDLTVQLARAEAKNEVLQELADKRLGGGGAKGFIPEAPAPYGYAEAVKAEPEVAAQAAAPAKPPSRQAKRTAAKIRQAAELEKARAAGEPLPEFKAGPWVQVSDHSCKMDINGREIVVSLSHNHALLSKSLID